MGRFKNSLANDRTSRGHVAWEIISKLEPNELQYRLKSQSETSHKNWNMRPARYLKVTYLTVQKQKKKRGQTKSAYHPSDAAEKTVKSKVCRPSGTSLMTWKAPKNIGVSPWQLASGHLIFQIMEVEHK